ncbi:MAG: hypothetical protein K1X39_05325 [Thermoflexales bacterium]|nr:hypothetical protein [Thermoflexales bacterium]
MSSLRAGRLALLSLIVSMFSLGVWLLLASPQPADAATLAAAAHAAAARTGHAALTAGRILSTTVADFDGPGTQVGGVPDALRTAGATLSPLSCAQCHVDAITGASGESGHGGWNGAMMSNAGRDPYNRAALAIADRQIGAAASFCGRCHMAGNWLRGEAPASQDGVQAFAAIDLEHGVSCFVCHRMVAITTTLGEAPRDAAERAAVPTAGLTLGNARNIYDRQDYRRGPFNSGPYSQHFVQKSSLTLAGELCGGCHDVSNPVFSLDPATGEYQLNALDASAPLTSAGFPLQRTYSEWKLSAFASPAGVSEVAGLYPGLKRSDDTLTGPVTVCQDCHMPRTTGSIVSMPDYPERFVSNHALYGGTHPIMAETLDAIWTGFDPAYDAVKKAQTWLAASEGYTNLRSVAVSVAATPLESSLRITVTNNAGHKFPSGYEEGRRAWVSVEASVGVSGQTVFTSGAFAPETGRILSGTFDTPTRIYEVKNGIGITLATQLGLPELAGAGFNQVLNNEVVHDTRIPPRGFTNAAYAAAQAAPVGASYADGQYWDVIDYPLDPCASVITVSVMYQQITGEYADFLSVAANFVVTDAVRGPTNWGELLAGRWTPAERLTTQTLYRVPDAPGCPARRMWVPTVIR